MKTPLLLAALLLGTVALPVASAGHTYNGCMSIWVQPPPGWDHACSVADWAAHNPVSPIASCIRGHITISIDVISINIAGIIACF